MRASGMTGMPLQPYQDSAQSPCRMKQERLLLVVAETGKPDVREGCSLSGPTILVSVLYSLTTKQRGGIPWSMGVGPTASLKNILF